MIQPIFEGLNSRVAITSESSSSVLGNLFDTVVTLTEEFQAKLPQHGEALTSMAAPADPACIFFVPTSQSEAHGVSFSHGALSTTLLGQGPAARISAQSRVMQLSSFNVDICISEIFTTFAHGGCVCIPSAAERLGNFVGAVNRMKVNWTYMTTLLSRKVDVNQVPSLRAVCFRTRSLDEDTFNAWHGKVNIILAYGPQDVCPLGISFLEALSPHQLKSLGRPFTGNLWIVNPEDQKSLMPVGAVGELAIEGPTLGCAYPNRESTMPQMTAPGKLAPGKNRYLRTGHRARYTEGGLMEFISTRDTGGPDGKSQVGITDVEQLIRRCLGQGIDVVVEMLAFRGPTTERMLAAFVELGDKLFDGEEDLKALSPATREQLSTARQIVESGLKSLVPPDMVPAIFIPVKHLPVTTSLKANRRRLGRLIQGMSKEQLLALSTFPKSTRDAKFQQLKPLPLTQSEEQMRSVWARVLGIEEAAIGALDTFFGLGGDEILAAQLISTCRNENLTVPVADVLRDTTLTELCRAVVTTETPESQLSSPAPSSATPGQAPVNRQALKEAFIENVIAPKIGLEASSIRDVAEASSMQVRYIETGMLRGRANINYFVFNFTGAVDAKKLEEACMMLVTIHAILRTAFVPYNRRVYQAVIKSAKIDFQRQLCATWRLAGMAEKTIRKDQTAPIAFCVPLTKFMFLDAGKQSTLILRLSKAQYDDISVALLVKDLKRLYDDTQNPARRPSHCDFMRSAQTSNSQGAEEYWKALLEGAAITHVVGHTHPYQVSPNIKTVRNLMPIGSLSSLGISFETVLKGAWAMVLASLSASSDVVFGEIIDGRNVRLGGGHSVVGVMGPTVNVIPVRVQFPDDPLTPLQLLQYLHGQRISGIPFENLGTLNIVERCTPWPYWSRLSTVVQHQYEDTAISPTETKSFHLGQASCKFTVMESKAQDVPDFCVRSIVRGPGRIELAITFCSDRVPEAFADHAMRMLCSTVTLLTSVSIMQPIVPSGLQYREMQKCIPLPPNASLPTSTTVLGNHEAVAMLTQEQMQGIQLMVAQAWTAVLNPRALGVPEDQVHNAAFYDLWGSLIPAAQLTAQINREVMSLNWPGVESSSLKVTMEEIVANPTMLKQFELIAVKIKSSAAVPTKGKDKEKGKDKAPVPGDNTRMPTIRKKPTIMVSASASILGSRIRRFASTMSRNGSPSTSKPTSTPLIPTSPLPISQVSSNSSSTSPLPSPQIIIADVDNPPAPSNGPPQLPSLPAFGAISEEPEMGSVTLTPRDISASSLDSMTDGSSASSRHSAEEESERGATTTPVAATAAVQSDIARAAAEAEEEDLVSPLSPGSMKGSRFFDAIAGRGGPSPMGSPGLGPGQDGAGRPNQDEGTRGEVLGSTGMAPVVG